MPPEFGELQGQGAEDDNKAEAIIGTGTRKMTGQFAAVGAGFSGAVVACQLARAGYRVDVYDQRHHVAGNCHTERDPATGILVHRYGPHIFHTSHAGVWAFVQQFASMMPYVNRVKAHAAGQVYSLPINLHTINQFYGLQLNPVQAEAFVRLKAQVFDRPVRNFEEQALSMMGRELYESFFYGYTRKQWGVEPSELPASILKRLPMRFDYNDNYYNSVYQGMPPEGYTALIERMLDHPNIRVFLNTRCDRSIRSQYQHVFYSGAIDAWFDGVEGPLRYRSLQFEQEMHHGDVQGNAVINYCDAAVPWTRISEHKHFAPWEQHTESIVVREYSTDCTENDIPYYPLGLDADKTILARYKQRAEQENNVTFMGRLGQYAYLDMHRVIEQSLGIAERFTQEK